MKVVAILQARLGSTRLPGKVLKEVQGKSLLEHQCERLSRCKSLSRQVVATTTLEADQAIVQQCEDMGVACFRGSESDVLERYQFAAVAFQAEVVVRLTSDCPLVDPHVVDQVVHLYLDSHFDYVSNCQRRTYPRGLDCEVFSARSLLIAHQEARLPQEREHVTPFFYTRPERFSIGHHLFHRDLSGHRWTVDTEADFQLIEKVYDALYPGSPQFSMHDVLSVLEQHPEWVAINAEVQQKPLA
ncbi:glycosyltransferase family protein [bacterium]|nr:glycosyltransferase family protein [bacterium]